MTPGLGAVSRSTFLRMATGMSVCQSVGAGTGPTSGWMICESLGMRAILQPKSRVSSGRPRLGRERIIAAMRIPFTKMQGAGNDFVVLDETRGRFGLTPAQYRFLGDRHFGVGADQILSVRPSPSEGIDFEYVIHNADGREVEQCGNGARCFARFVRDSGLSNKDTLRVQTKIGRAHV